MPMAMQSVSQESESEHGCSCVLGVKQVFVGSGEALTTRVYRRQPPDADGVTAGVHLVAHGGPLQVVSAEAHLMDSIWG